MEMNVYDGGDRMCVRQRCEFLLARKDVLFHTYKHVLQVEGQSRFTFPLNEISTIWWSLGNPSKTGLEKTTLPIFKIVPPKTVANPRAIAWDNPQAPIKSGKASVIAFHATPTYRATAIAARALLKLCLSFISYWYLR